MNEFEQKVLGELSALRTQMNHLLGIGQPGRLHALEMRVARHERKLQRVRGMIAAVGTMLTAAHVVITMWMKGTK